MNETPAPAEPAKAGKSQAPAPAEAHDPWRSLTEFRREMDRMLEGFSTRFFPNAFSAEPFSVFGAAGGKLAPAVDIVESDGGYTVTAEVPGMAEKDLDISIDGEMLTIKGEKQENKEEKKENYRLSERRYGALHRSFRMPADVDAEKIEAAYDKGVLTLTLPKSGKAQVKRKKIAIKGA